jgi:hypothetical protein
MKLKTILNPKNWFYFIKGHWIMKRGTFTKEELLRVSKRSASCPECTKNIYCFNCGCPAIEMFLANKPCEND